jgi:hypothetical protein
MDALAHHPKAAELAAELGVNLALPFALYALAKGPLGEVGGLISASAPPIVWSLSAFARRRRVDAISLLTLAGVTLSLLAFIGSGAVQMLQLREKLVTGLIGLAFLASVAVGRPLVHEIARAGMRRRSPEGLAAFEARHGREALRRDTGLITLVWGVGLLADVAVSCVLVFSLSVPTYLLVNPLLGYGVMGLLSLWTIGFARRRGLSGNLSRSGAPAAIQ